MMSRWIAVLRWVAVLAGIGVALTFATYVIGNMWVASFHDPYEQMYLHHAYQCLGYSTGAALLSAAAFIAWWATSRSRAIKVLVALGLLSVAAPHLRRFMLDDICLDSGGAVNRATLACEK